MKSLKDQFLEFERKFNVKIKSIKMTESNARKLFSQCTSFEYRMSCDYQMSLFVDRGEPLPDNITLFFRGIEIKIVEP